MKQRNLRNLNNPKPKFNQETLDAMQEALDIRAGKIQAKRYDSVEEMFADDDDDA